MDRGRPDARILRKNQKYLHLDLGRESIFSAMTKKFKIGRVEIVYNRNFITLVEIGDRLGFLIFKTIDKDGTLSPNTRWKGCACFYEQRELH